MKKIILVSCLLLISYLDSYGQWYVKKYNVSDINLLSQEQLEKSLRNSKNGLLASGFCAGLGAILFFVPETPSDDPTFFQQLIGEKGQNAVNKSFGVGLMMGGTIASIVYLGRIGRIKTVIKENYPTEGTLNILPTFMLNNYTRSWCSGFTLTYNF
jgi:hypothetical protein